MSGRAVRPGRPGERGIALLLVVWLLALLAVIGGEFMASGRVRAAAESNKRDDLRAFALALAGYQAALAALGAEIEKVSLNDDVLTLHVAGETEGTPALATDVALEDGSYTWRIGDEDGRVNINDEKRRSVFAGLLERCGMPPGAERDTVIDSIIDWRDPGREHQLNGAEEEWYRALDPPYSCKDGPFDVVEELLLVRGVTPELFAGGEVDGERRPGLRDLLSVHAGTLNAATASDDVLEAIPMKRLREGPPSAHYEIVSTGVPAGGDARRSIRAVVLRKPESAGRYTFTLLYWNDRYLPTENEERGER